MSDGTTTEAPSYDTTEGRIFTVSGEDWDSITAPPEGEQERLVVNMGPQHPSTHGVLRLVLELDGETVTEGALRDRLPAHGHREEPGVPLVDPGHDVRDPHGLPVAVLQRGRVLPKASSGCWGSRTRSRIGRRSSGS